MDEALQFGEVSASVEVLVFATGPPRYRSFGKSVRLYTIPAPRSSIVFWRLWPVMTFLVVLYVTLISLSRQVNIVRADDTLKAGFGSLIGSRICRLPFAAILGGDYLEILQTRSSKSANLMSTVFRAIQSTVLSGSSIVVTYNSRLADKVKTVSKAHILLTGPYYNARTFQPSKKLKGRNSFSVLHVGRLEAEKGLDILLKIIEKLKHEDVHFTIVGGGTLSDALIASIEKLGLRGIVSFAGSVDHSMMPDFYAKSDVYLLTSRTEGGPATVLEALGCGVPVVSTPVGIVPDLAVMSRYVKLFAPNDPDEAASEILRFKRENETTSFLRKNLVPERYNTFLESQLTTYDKLTKGSRVWD